MSALAQQNHLQYVYDFATLDRVPEGPTSAKVAAKRLLSGPTLKTGKSSTVGAVLTGTHIILTLGTQARGSGANAHTHSNEQFNYIVQGTMMGEIAGELVFAPRGTMLHTPGRGRAHGARVLRGRLGVPCAEGYAARHHRPVVGRQVQGPNYLPGFGTRADERMRSTAELIAESGRDPAGEKIRYVYDFAHLENSQRARVERQR